MKKAFGLVEIMIIIAIIAMFVALVVPYILTERKNEEEGIRVTESLHVDGTIKEVYLEDGTRCAVLIGDRKGGISCDWKGGKHYE